MRQPFTRSAAFDFAPWQTSRFVCSGRMQGWGLLRSIRNPFRGPIGGGYSPETSRTRTRHERLKGGDAPAAGGDYHSSAHLTRVQKKRGPRLRAVLAASRLRAKCLVSRHPCGHKPSQDMRGGLPHSNGRAHISVMGIAFCERRCIDMVQLLLACSYWRVLRAQRRGDHEANPM